jgi:hypothetical protein
MIVTPNCAKASFTALATAAPAVPASPANRSGRCKTHQILISGLQFSPAVCWKEAVRHPFLTMQFSGFTATSHFYFNNTEYDLSIS